jgi:hypothetical protein
MFLSISLCNYLLYLFLHIVPKIIQIKERIQGREGERGRGDVVVYGVE